MHEIQYDIMFDKITELTKKMVGISSVNASEGERKIGDFLYDYLCHIPYFIKHPDQVMAVELANDPLGRRNVFALLLGEKDDSKDTIMLHGHTDTVGVEDFGSLSGYAFDCDRLMEELKKIQDTLPEEVREDLNSGDYLFGRGTSDMKGGDAVHMVVLEELSKYPERLSGNILLSLNPVEESLHTGIIEGLDTIRLLRDKYGLNYLFGINNDFICGMYPGDETRYVYTGSVGKLLPCYYVRGRETHVGQAFEGFDACMVAAEIVKAVNLNCSYCDGYMGEYPAPPSVLRMQDLKPYYSVQTPFSSFVYFNYMVHNKNVNEVLSEMKQVAAGALAAVSKGINDRYLDYCRITGITHHPVVHKTQVLEYREVYEKAKALFHEDLDAYIDKLTEASVKAGEDKRNTALKIVEALSDIANIKLPTVVVFFAPPHCPHNTLKSEVPEENVLIGKLQEILDGFGKEHGESFKIMHFFPSLTDSSYLKIDDDAQSIQALRDNFPKQEVLYPVPYERIRSLNIPGLNYGTFGKDAHKWTERVKMSYSFDKLPKLILKTIETYLMR